MNALNKTGTLLSVAMLTLLSGFGAQADDTEIFVAKPPTTADTRPNILFILDTSGSMDTKVEDRAPFDPKQDYTPSKNGCASDRVYWNKSGSSSPPECSTDQWVSTGNFVCKTAKDKLALHGSWPIGPAAQWRGKSKYRWDSLAGDRDSYIECQADADIKHGLADNDNKYPADGSKNGPYSSNSSQGITWTGNAASSYIFYSGNYLNWYYYAPRSDQGTRMDIVKQAAKDTLDRLSNVNVGLMRYSSDADGGMVVAPMATIESSRDTLKATIDAFEPNGGTPLSETFYEAYRYMSGGKVLYGLDSKPITSIASSQSGGKYISPIKSSCQKNFIVYLTDGDPTVDQDATARIEALPNFSTLGNLTTNPTNGGVCTDNGAIGNEGGGAQAGDGKCLDDLAKYMYEKDFLDDPDLDINRDPKENIRTYTIGFGDGVSARGLALIKSTAQAGGGAFYEAGDTASLTEAFNSIISEVLDDNISFTAPAVSVNAFNRTQNLNDLFITVFKPDSTYHWPGNLKKYRLDPSGVIMDNSTPDPKPAVDPNSGFFDKSARSFWLGSGSADGADVEKGGAAKHIPKPDDRLLFTDTGALAATGATSDLTASSNELATDNALITSTMLGLPDDATDDQRTALIDWVRGLDDDSGTDRLSRMEMGDPLHARPVSVIYGGSAAAPEAVVFMATNDGYLHAIDPSDGSELWAFVPSELLGRMFALRENADSAVKRYGLDGNLVAYRIDRNNNGIIESADGDRIYLYFGMGRGGNNYYALDVTDKTSPEFLWRNGADGTLTGMGQTWSTPVITKVLVGDGSAQNADRLVMIVGGGYDATQDAIPYNTDDTGNSIFILDALDGSLLWHAGQSGADYNNAKMNNSIPADIRVLDMSNDGYADRMYVADTGARIWRFDIVNGQPKGTLVRGGIFASLGVADGTGTSPADARRFYNAPDAALLRANNRFYLNLAIGSGYRGHPLNAEIHEAFYSLRDQIPFAPMSDADWTAYTPITHTDSNLIDVTTNANAVIPATARGWKIELSQPSWQGEKVLSEARTFNNSILFPTFSPVGNTQTTSCTAQTGTNTLYVVRIDNGGPVLNRDGNATPDVVDRSIPLKQHGIAPSAAVFFPTPDPDCEGAACKPAPVCLVGVEHCGISFTNDPVKTFWNNRDADTTE